MTEREPQKKPSIFLIFTFILSIPLLTPCTPFSHLWLLFSLFAFSSAIHFFESLRRLAFLFRPQAARSGLSLLRLLLLTYVQHMRQFSYLAITKRVVESNKENAAKAGGSEVQHDTAIE